MRSTIWQIPKRAFFGGAATLLALAAAGCSSSGGGAADGGSPLSQSSTACVPGSASAGAECGTVLVALTDAEGDFVSYSVDVVSLTLERASGATVETLPAATRVDFAQLVELADLLAAATVAPGDFVGGTLSLDYSNAEIFVESGGDVVPAQAVDADGQPLGTVEVEIRLADRSRLVVTRGRAAFLSVDFDLAASHTVDTSQAPAQVTVRPYVVAEVMPVDEKELRVRGALLDVDVAAAEYSIAVRPWHRRLGNHGAVTVHTTAATAFEIGAVGYTGAAGLEALAALDDGTLTVAFGTLDLTAREFTAEIVHARESVAGVGADAVYGHVVARDGNRLTVGGAFAIHRDGEARFRRLIDVEVGTETAVSKTGSGTLHGEAAISVGQRVVAFGELALPSAGADPILPPVLDATDGRVRLLVTRLHGAVNGAITGQLNLDLRAIDRLPVALFDFAGTGAAPVVDADPEDYEIATGPLALATLEPGEAASVLGFVAPFGAAPPDFEGRTVIDHAGLRARLGIGWAEGGTSAPFVSLEPTGLVLDLANASIGGRHHLAVGYRVTDLFDLPASPAIVPAAGRASFGIAEGGRIELYDDFGEFVTDLALKLGGGSVALGLTAHGHFEPAIGTLTARRVAVVLRSPSP